MTRKQEFETLMGTSLTVQADVLTCSVPREQFTALIRDIVLEKQVPLSFLFGTDDRASAGTFGVHVVCSLADSHEWLMISTALPKNDPRYESLTKTVMAAHWYERFMMDQFGIIAEGHPDPRRLVHHENVPEGTYPLRKDFALNTKMEQADVPYPMHHVQGEGIYEIPVGPIHAGIIEPGHFRFNVGGERIITLEGKLFFTHKGVEKLLEGKTIEQALPFIERVSGDAAASHTLAFCEAIEKITDVNVPQRAQALRVLICELERVTMHIHDLANIGGMGTGYTLMAAQGFRVKERLMRLSERVFGNRFWRGAIVPGGFATDLTAQQLKDLERTVQDAINEMHHFVELGLRSSGFRERLETTGVLSKDAAIAYGAKGLPARASGVDIDVRRDHPYGAYKQMSVQIVTKTYGDVFARFLIRLDELDVSLDFIKSLIASMKSGSVHVPVRPASGMSLGAVESWRGEILTFVALENGVITRCFPRDPSFCNWALFGEIGPGNIVPDFPLCNKSLNLSYSGTDL